MKGKWLLHGLPFLNILTELLSSILRIDRPSISNMTDARRAEGMKVNPIQIGYLALNHLLVSTIGNTNVSNLVEMIALLFTRARPKRIL